MLSLSDQHSCLDCIIGFFNNFKQTKGGPPVTKAYDERMQTLKVNKMMIVFNDLVLFYLAGVHNLGTERHYMGSQRIISTSQALNECCPLTPMSPDI